MTCQEEQLGQSYYCFFQSCKTLDDFELNQEIYKLVKDIKLVNFNWTSAHLDLCAFRGEDEIFEKEEKYYYETQNDFPDHFKRLVCSIFFLALFRFNLKNPLGL